MHGYSDSLDSSVNIRTNPLNIHMQDGSDLVIDNPSPSQFVSSSKPTVVKPESPTPQKAERLYAQEANVSRHSINEPVQPLNLSKSKSPTESVNVYSDVELSDSTESPVSESQQLDKLSPVADLSIPEFSPLLALDLDKFSLERQNTIKSPAAVESAPSKSAALFQRIRSLRTHQPDPSADEPLPSNLLKVIQFSPSLDWPSDANSICSGSPTLTQGTSPALSQSEKIVENIDVANAETEQDEEAEKPIEDKFEPVLAQTDNEALHLSDIAEVCEVSEAPEQSQSAVQEASPSVQAGPSPNISTRDSVEPEAEPEVQKTPDITETDPITESDRGRMFMQIRRLQSLRGVPIDPARNPRFTLTLDNGVQTVTTPPVALPSSKLSGTIHANIGQEFELVVGRELELVMTLNILMDAIQPPPKPRSLGMKEKAPIARVAQVVPEDKKESPPATPKQSRMKSFFSPKRSPKRKSKVAQQKVEEEQIQKHDDYVQAEKEHDAQMIEYRRRRDFWKGLTGPSGEYARGYLFESHYEREIYGKAESYSLPLYNEWQGGEAIHMGDLEVRLMFIPRLYGSEKLPSSLSAAQNQLKAAQLEKQFSCKGYLTQNGGDCRVYRRRYFTLDGSEFVAHHEATHKLRAVIHMENVTEILDSETVTANDNMWCIYEDRSFLLVFGDGEEVSFYADTPEQKNAWVNALSKSMNFCTGKRQSWEDLVIEQFEANSGLS